MRGSAGGDVARTRGTRVTRRGPLRESRRARYEYAGRVTFALTGGTRLYAKFLGAMEALESLLRQSGTNGVLLAALVGACAP